MGRTSRSVELALTWSDLKSKGDNCLILSSFPSPGKCGFGNLIHQGYCPLVTTPRVESDCQLYSTARPSFDRWHTRACRQFSDSLRYCEDYYLNGRTVFTAKGVLISEWPACSLSMVPGPGGEKFSPNVKRSWESSRLNTQC